MKKLITILVLLVGLTAFAQPVVKGVKIEGKAQTVLDNLVKAGWTFEKNIPESCAYILNGSFAGLGECFIFMNYTKTTKEVWSLFINTIDYSSWFSLKTDFLKLVDSYDSKYGTSLFLRKFDYPYEEGDGYELSAIKNQKCTYSNYWDFEKFNIMVNINQQCAITISYINKDAEAIYKSEQQSKINDDI